MLETIKMQIKLYHRPVYDFNYDGYLYLKNIWLPADNDKKKFLMLWEHYYAVSGRVRGMVNG